jgi:hypothetical protein
MASSNIKRISDYFRPFFAMPYRCLFGRMFDWLASPCGFILLVVAFGLTVVWIADRTGNSSTSKSDDSFARAVEGALQRAEQEGFHRGYEAGLAARERHPPAEEASGTPVIRPKPFDPN